MSDQMEPTKRSNMSVGFGADFAKGVENSVALGSGAICKDSNTVVLGNEDTRKLQVAGLEISSDDHGICFIHLKTGRKYRMVLSPD